jgi:hypothetical protein
MSFSVREFRDSDLMLRLKETGPIPSKELAHELGFDEFGSHLGRRLGWMGHYGMVERDAKTKMWSLTEAGARVIWARKRAALMRELDSLPAEELIEVMAAVMARYQRGDPLTATMMRREFIYGSAHR